MIGRIYINYTNIITSLEFEGKLIFPLITANATESPRSYTKS